MISRIDMAYLDSLIDNACQVVRITREQFESRCRKQKFCLARQMVWLKLSSDGYSLHDIGDRTGKTHSTVIHGINKLKDTMSVKSGREERKSYEQFLMLSYGEEN